MAEINKTHKELEIGVKANTKKAEHSINKLGDNPITIGLDIDIKNAITSINEALSKMQKSFDGKVQFSGIQKGLDDVIAKIESVTKVFNANTPKEINAINVNLVGIKKLQDATDAIQRNVELLNDSKIDLNTFERLTSVLENIETLVNSIVKGMNFESIRPSVQVQKDIDSTTDKLKNLEKQEKKILELEDYLGRTGISKGKQIIDWGDSEDVKAVDNLIKKIKEYISLGGDLSKFQFKTFNPLTNVKELYSLQDVFDILTDEGKIDVIDSSKISNDVIEVKNLRNELSNLNRELDEAKARENRDLNVSLDTKSVDEFATAIQSAVQSIGQLNISIPEGFTFDGLSTENLDKIVIKLEEIIDSISRIGDLLSTGVDTSKLEKETDNIKVNVVPDFSPRDFTKSIEERLYNEGVFVPVKPIVYSEEDFIASVEGQLTGSRKVNIAVNPNVFSNSDDEELEIKDALDPILNKKEEALKEVFSNVASDFGDSLIETIGDFKDALESGADLNYEVLFESLRTTLLHIVEEFQRSLNNVNFTGSSFDDLYNTLKSWNDSSKVMTSASQKDSERLTLANLDKGTVSTSHVVGKEGNITGDIVQSLNRFATGVSQRIDELYDTWVHSHPLRDTGEHRGKIVKNVGSDIGFSYGDIESEIQYYLSQGIKKMLVENNGKYTKLDLSSATEEQINDLLNNYLQVRIKSADFTDNGLEVRTSSFYENGVLNLDKKSEIMNNALKEALTLSGLSDSLLTTGNIEDLKVDLSKLHQEETEATNKAQELFDVIKNISDVLDTFNQSNTFKLDGVDNLVSNLEDVKRLLDEISSSLKNGINVNQTPKDDSSNIEDGLNTEKKVVDKVVDQEKSKISELVGSVDSVTDAVGRKTDAFQNEKTEVDSVVDQEKAKLQELSSTLDEIANKVKSIIDLEIKVTDGTSVGNDSGQGSEGKKSNRGRKPKATDSSEKGFKVPDGWVTDVNQAWDAALLENIEQTAKAYEDLTDKLKKYYDLKNKELKGNKLTPDESETLDKLNKEIEKAISGKGKYSNATEKAAIAQKKFNDSLKDRNQNSSDTYLNDINSLYENKKSISDTKMPEYKNILSEINKQIELLRSKTPIDFTDDSQFEDFKKARKEIDKLFNDLNSKSLDKATTTEIDTVLKNINKRLNQSSAMPKEYKDQLKALRTEIELLSNSASGIDKITLANFKSQLVSIENQIEKTGRTGLSLMDKMKKKVKDLAAYFLTYVSFQDFIQVLRQGFETIKEYDTALTGMKKVSDESISTLKSFQKESFELADSVGTTAKQIQNSTADWMRLGESLEDAKKSAQSANILYNVSEFESIGAATESLVSMSQAFKDLEKGEIIDVVNNLGNNFAISTDGLATALQNSASALQTAKNDFFESAALTTAANTVVQDPNKVGAGLRTIALRLTGTEAAKKELEELGEDISDFTVTTTSKLNQQIIDLTKTQDGFGVSLLDVNGNYRSTYDILLDIANVWEQIAKEDLATGENRQNALLEMMAGKNRSNILASILQSPEVLKEAYEEALNSEGSALKENEAYLESIEAHLLQLKNAWDALWVNENNREVITLFLDLAKSVLDAVNSFGVLKTLLFGGGGIFALFKTFNKNGRHKWCALFLCL